MNNESNTMVKKWIITLVLILVVCLAAYFAYDFYNRNSMPQTQTEQQNHQVQTLTPGTVRSGTSTVPVLSADQKLILNAAILKMSKVMESKDVKKIRAFLTSLYPNKADQDAIAKLPDSQLLQSAQVFKEFNVASSLSLALSALPSSAWSVGSTTATITQSTTDGKNTVFTVNKVNGVWQ